jgi:hypothetical protein
MPQPDTLQAIALSRLCTPRPTVFERARADTVANIADLMPGGFGGRAFFGENHITEGMRVLFRQIFDFGAA